MSCTARMYRQTVVLAASQLTTLMFVSRQSYHSGVRCVGLNRTSRKSRQRETARVVLCCFQSTCAQVRTQQRVAESCPRPVFELQSPRTRSVLDLLKPLDAQTVTRSDRSWRALPALSRLLNAVHPLRRVERKRYTFRILTHVNESLSCCVLF